MSTEQTDLIRQMAELKLIGDFKKDSKYNMTKALSTIFEELQGWATQENVNIDEVLSAAKAKIHDDLKQARGEYFGKTTIEKIEKLGELVKQYIVLHYQGKWRKMLRDQFKLLNAYLFYARTAPKSSNNE